MSRRFVAALASVCLCALRALGAQEPAPRVSSAANADRDGMYLHLKQAQLIARLDLYPYLDIQRECTLYAMAREGQR